MLYSINELYGNKLGASDGDIGHVKDFLFDDQTWAVRYVVADTGSWLSERQVLLSPHPFQNLFKRGNVLPVNLTRQQIADSPSIESHKPVSRQFEEAYYRLSGKEVQLLTSEVERISYEESSVLIKVPREAVEQCPTHRVVSGTVSE